MTTLLEMPVANRLEVATVAWLQQRIAKARNTVPFAEAALIPPGLANYLLAPERNHDNRALKPIKLEQFLADMHGGRWSLNGEPIIISLDGELNDGQHRLHAIARYNHPVAMMIAFGVERETRHTTDQGAVKNAADYLTMEGRSYGTRLATVARIVLAYERSGGQRIIESRYVTNAEIMERIEADQGIFQAVQFMIPFEKYSQRFCVASVLSAAYYILAERNEPAAQAYIEQVAIGEGIKRGDPAFTVRDTFNRVGRAHQARLEVLFHGWNAFRRSKPLNIIRVLGNFPALAS